MRAVAPTYPRSMCLASCPASPTSLLMGHIQPADREDFREKLDAHDKERVDPFEIASSLLCETCAPIPLWYISRALSAVTERTIAL